MKRRMILIITMVMFLAACSQNTQEQVSIMTWGGDFIPSEMIEQFEAETNIKVQLKEVTSNEEMQNLLENSAGQYDLAVVTDYMVDILRQNQTIQKFDQNQLEYFSALDENYLYKYYDETSEYSIPYTVSTAVMVYNAEKVDQTIDSYNALWDETFKNSVVTIDGAVEVMGIVSKVLGQKVNDPDPQAISAVKEKLFSLKEQIVRFETNTPQDSLLNGEANLGFMYSNQAAKAIQENPNMVPVFAKEGIPIYIDAFVMAKDAPNPEHAYAFLNFMMKPENSAKTSEIIQFTNVNKEAKAYLSEAFLANPLLNMPAAVAENTFFYTNLEKVIDQYEDIYTEFKLQ